MAFDAATAVTHRNATLVVLAGELFFAQRERLERFLGRDLIKILGGLLALGGSSGAISFNTHY